MQEQFDYASHAAPVHFPRGPHDLTGTTSCPACFSPLRATICRSCGLDLNHPAAGELYEASLDAARALDARLAIIGRMRVETEQRAAAQQSIRTEGTAAASAAAHAPVGTAPAASATATATAVPPVESATPVPAPPTPPASAPRAPSDGPDRPRRSSIQVLLLVVGVSLLSIAAIFFLVYAFVMFGIVVRSVIIGAITIAAFVTAGLLARRSLTATAEGIAAFAIVLIYLDAWALRANFSSVEAIDGSTYWGLVLVGAAVGLLAWHRSSRLRLPSVAAFISLQPGLGVLTEGLARELDSSIRGVLVVTLVALGGVVFTLVQRGRLLERIVIVICTSLALMAAALWALRVLSDSTWAPSVAMAAVATTAAVLAVTTLARGGTDALARGWAHALFAFLGLVATVAIAVGAIRSEHELVWSAVPAISATAVALAIEALSRRGPWRAHARTATIAAAAAAALTALPAIVLATLSAVVSAAQGLVDRWALPLDSHIAPVGLHLGGSVLALAGALALVTLSWRVQRVLAVRSAALVWALVPIAIVAIPLLGSLVGVFAGWTALAALCFAALLVLRGRPQLSLHRPALIAGLSISAALGYLVGWGGHGLWWVGTLVVLAVLLGSRRLVVLELGRTVLLSAALVLAIASAAPLAASLWHPTPPGELAARVSMVSFVAIAAVVALVLSALPVGTRLTMRDRAAAFWISLAASTLSIATLTPALAELSDTALSELLLPGHATHLAVSATGLAGLGLWMLVRANHPRRRERMAAAALVTPALLAALTAFARLLEAPSFVHHVVPVSAALLGAAGSLAVALTRPSSTPRLARELGVALVGIPAVAASVWASHETTWLALTLAGVAALLLAISRDGLVGSASPRRSLGWLALALGTSGLWWRLVGDQVTALEPYVLPLAAVLLAIALWVARTERRTSREVGAVGGIALAGLLATVLPLALDAVDGSLTRAIVLGAVSAALLLVGSFGPRSAVLLPWLDAAAVAGSVGAIALGVGRAVLAPDATTADAWVAALVAVMLAAGFGQVRRAASPPRRTAGIALAVVALSAALAIEVPLFDAPLGELRALALVLLFGAVHVVALLVSTGPLTPAVGWLAIACGGAAAIASGIIGRLNPLELVTVPLALALLATGAHRLANHPTARSWPWLGPACAMLLVPSLALTLEDRPLWRLVALGIVAVGMIAIGATARLQAPLAIGAVVALWHGIATFLPQLRAVYESVEWWLWLGVGGVLLIVLAARYEKRIRSLKSVAMRFAALR